ncbi:uncharacterized protein HMPREF1541_10803 [Cyphellophora europaea CBS 101466]|uniref:DNA endonuclease activator Ctp1 C-terminal domain-containing protein n=1 Tax=Cyphellophora europaea (strain CBS 101466) TaxID=1220924 RepID=W2S6D3_CYPE1|nr:uncharacterized protein HMPREF1541_10803 [Cyphellophora europaea CBS 101466]ETN44252.1 hypothetical protein HMPREF1541_10803 [Cyphellophora europaea CBS 101466]
MPQADTPLTELLTQALSQSQTLVKQVEEQSQVIDRLFQSVSEKQAEIDRLKKVLGTTQAKERKWRLQNPQIPSPVVLSDEIDQTNTSQPSTPVASACRPESFRSSPQIQVQSSPPRKKQRLESREGTPLREVQNNTKLLPRSVDRVEKAIAAIPILAEDGEVDSREGKHQSKSSKVDPAVRGDAAGRLDALLGSPAPSVDLFAQRPTSASPRANNRSVPTLRKSSSDLEATDRQVRRKPRFVPHPPQRKEQPPLRSRPVSSLKLSDFVLRPEYLEEWHRPRDRRKSALGASDHSEEDLLLDYLGAGSKNMLANMTKTARDNALHEARIQKIAQGFAERSAPLVTAEWPGGGYWEVEFGGTQEDEKRRNELVERTRAEVEHRVIEAMKPDGRYKFRDE